MVIATGYDILYGGFCSGCRRSLKVGGFCSEDTKHALRSCHWTYEYRKVVLAVDIQNMIGVGGKNYLSSDRFIEQSPTSP